MSGGVDSSTAAGILIRQGYEVIGINMRLPDTGEVSESGCCGVAGIDDARNVAQKLGIPFYALNYEKEFENEVIDYFYQEYMNGRTPNPCIICNEKIKFRSLLKKGKDIEKDQSYFLFSLSQEQLSHSLFPLGNYTKSRVRELAREFGLKVHNKPASQEICFIPDNDYRRFLTVRFITDKFKPGLIVDKNGRILGKHRGIAFYTIGQRKGIGAYKKPFYVISINKEKNTIAIGEEKELYQDTLIAEKVNWIDRKKLNDSIKAKARIRYKHRESDAVISPLSDTKVKVQFNKPQRAITSGQAVVFYDGDTVIGGGWIC